MSLLSCLILTLSFFARIWVSFPFFLLLYLYFVCVCSIDGFLNLFLSFTCRSANILEISTTKHWHKPFDQSLTGRSIKNSQVGFLHRLRPRTIRGSRWHGKLKGSFLHLNLDIFKGFCFFLIWGTCMLYFFQVGSCVFPAGRSKTLQVIMKTKRNVLNH